VPNAISLARLALVPVFAVLIVRGADLAAVGVLALAGLSDWLDGVLARRLKQVSELGRILDPAADRAFIVVTVLALAWRQAIGWWLVALLLAREALMAGVLIWLKTRGHRPPQVLFVGKAATLALMYAFPLLLLATLPGWPGQAAWIVGWALAIWGVWLYWVAAACYTVGAARTVHGSGRRPAAGPYPDGGGP
jgi:cardiolipin synthase